MLRFLFILFGMICTGVISYAQCIYTLKGKVIDHHDRKPLEYAEIFIREIKQGALTDSIGNYEIKNLCNGSYTITCRHLGCEEIITSVVVDGNTIQNFYPEHHLHELGLVDIVTEKTKEKPTTILYEMKGKELEQKRGLSLGEALKSVVGVNAIQTGSSISKPVIHGLHSNRILILNNGIRQEGQQWGSEHAPEIDPFIANQLTVIKGANAVKYGSDAIAGVILVEPAKLRDSAGIGGELNLVGYSNGRAGIVSAMLEQNFKKIPPLSWRLQGTFKKSGNVNTPNYFLNNTALEEYNFSGAAGWKKTNYGAEIFYSQFNTSLGIYSGSHIGNVTDLMAVIDGTKTIENDSFSFAISRPYQHIEHELFKANAYIRTGEKGKLNIVYARQYNLRNEFDTHKSKNGGPQLQFEITSHTIDLFWEHAAIKHFTGTIGASGMKQGNTYKGRYFIPNFQNNTAGAYWIERYSKNRFQLEAGVRYDYRFLQVYKYENNSIISPFYEFDNVSGTLGLLYKLGSFLNFSANAGTAWRAPAINELYGDGIHHGAATYEIGNRNLKTEKATNFIAGLYYDNQKKWKYNISTYYNLIDNYIYLKPQFPATVSISGSFPTFVYSQTNATFLGSDAQISFLPISQLIVSAKASVLWAKDKTKKEYLIQMPADRAELGLTYNLKNSKKISDTYLSIAGMYENRQWRVPANSDYMVPPAAYFLLNAELAASFHFNKQKIIIGIGVKNMLNTTYRNYMNRFRYYADETGRNISLRIKIPINYSPKNESNYEN